MKKETYAVACPKSVRFGDPDYWNDFKGKKLASLVVDCKPPTGFDAVVVLTEEPYEKYPEMMELTMTLVMAPEKLIDIYAEGYYYKGQSITEKEIGVDSACYLIEVDGRYHEFHTGGDGYWGEYAEYSRVQGSLRKLDAIVMIVSMSEFETFESMRDYTNYFFPDAQLLSASESPTNEMRLE